MKPGNHEGIPTVSQVLRDAAAICDPGGTETAVTALVEGFEDDDRPVTAVDDLAGDLLETVGAIDPEGDDPAATATAVAAVWLATQPGQEHDENHVLREGTRFVFEGEPPKPLVEWLGERGVKP